MQYDPSLIATTDVENDDWITVTSKCKAQLNQLDILEKQDKQERLEKSDKNESALFIPADIEKKPSEKATQKRKPYRKIIPLFYKDGEPQITIGPHCKKSLNI
jgi:hypothetical protein